MAGLGRGGEEREGGCIKGRRGVSAMLTELEKEGRRPNLPPSLILHRGLSQDGDSGVT